MPNADTFMRVTNADIFKEVQSLHDCLGSLKGRVRLNTWIASTALSLCIGTIVGGLLI